MFKPSDFLPDVKRRGHRLAAIAGLALSAASGMLLLHLPLGASAGVAPADGDRNAVAVPTQKAPATYQLRCWQYGRLLFDEGPVTLGAEARQGARLVAIDRHGAPFHRPFGLHRQFACRRGSPNHCRRSLG